MSNETKAKDDAQGKTISNVGYDNANVLQIRLNTEPLLTKTEMFFRGEREMYIIKEGVPKIIAEKTGRRKANDEGIHSMMLWIGGVINSQIVQGNIENFNELCNKVADYRLDFSEYVMKNLINWEIKDSDYEGIIDIVITQVDLFLSRLVGNKERDSYSNTIRHTESSSSEVRGRSGFKIPGF